VTGSNCIAAHLSQYLEPSFPDPLGDCGAHRSPLVVQADSVDFDVLAVEQEATVGIEEPVTNPKRRLVFIYYLLAGMYRAAYLIQIR
jgi:hypothetical protein